MTINVALVFAVVYGVATHKRWLWITAGTVLGLLLIAFLLLGGVGSGGAGYEVYE